MGVLQKFFGASQLDQARKSNTEAREACLSTMRAAEQSGSVVIMSREALERITEIEPSR